jgi:metallo-beta-lactamase class B
MLRSAYTIFLALFVVNDARTEMLPQLKAYEVAPGWITTIEPVRISDHVWQVGTAEITSLLIRTDAGAVLIDGGMPQAADAVLANMKRLGLAPRDLRYVLHSHAHGDHVGAVAAIKRATGATLVSNAESAVMLERGGSNDIHFGDAIVYPSVHADRLLQDGETVRLGTTSFQVWFTPGHTPGSMSWTWSDTHNGKPVRIAYVDSLTAPGYTLQQNPAYPGILKAYEHSFATVRKLPCDLLLTPHPDRSGWKYDDAKQPQQKSVSCAEYADSAEEAIRNQLSAENKAAN